MLQGAIRGGVIPALAAVTGLLVGTIIRPAFNDRLGMEGRFASIETRVSNIEINVSEIRTQLKESEKDRVHLDDFQALSRMMEEAMAKVSHVTDDNYTLLQQLQTRYRIVPKNPPKPASKPQP